MKQKLDYKTLIYSNSGFGVTLLSNAISLFFIVLSLFFICFSITYISVPVEGTSMQPLLNPHGQEENDIVYINKFASFTRGDIVVIKQPNESGKYIIKRIIAVGGDTIKIIPGNSPSGYVLVLNGEIIDESAYLYEYKVNIDKGGTDRTYQKMQNLQYAYPDLFNDKDELVVPKGYIFALGDNRGVSVDSSELGPFKSESVVGKVDHIIKDGDNELIYFFNKYTPFKFKQKAVV